MIGSLLMVHSSVWERFADGEVSIWRFQERIEVLDHRIVVLVAQSALEKMAVKNPAL